ncbi:MAG: hypothetical protein MSA56_09845 [Clostridium sp.]|nr:hypothetical protein [Clostridium sp.]
MSKALTKEDLVYILQGIFRLSTQPDNAFQMLDDGLYVKDYQNDFDNHTDDTGLHITQDIRDILDLFSIDANDNLLYDGKPVNVAISGEANNAIKVKPDGIYVEDIFTETKKHIQDADIHVTKTDKETWNKTLQDAKDFTMDEIDKLVIYDIKEVDVLPTENISSTTLYLLTSDPEHSDECEDVMYMYLRDKWITLSITNRTLKLLATKKELEDYAKKDDLHKHDNKDLLDKFSNADNGDLLYGGKSLHEFELSEAPNNAAKLKDGKLFVEDFSEVIRSLQIASAISKTRLYTGDITESGRYDLADDIDNYSMIMIDYYYKPADPDENPGCAKTAVVDTETLNELYDRGIDYMLELGYGISTSNVKIHFNQNTLWVNYYNNVCIYKITGIGGVNND